MSDPDPPREGHFDDDSESEADFADIKFMELFSDDSDESCSLSDSYSIAQSRRGLPNDDESLVIIDVVDADPSSFEHHSDVEPFDHDSSASEESVSNFGTLSKVR